MIIGYDQNAQHYLVIKYNQRNLINLIHFLNKCSKPLITRKCLGRRSFEMKVGEDTHHVCYNETDIDNYHILLTYEKLYNINYIHSFGTTYEEYEKGNLKIFKPPGNNKIYVNSSSTQGSNNNSSTPLTKTALNKFKLNLKNLNLNKLIITNKKLIRDQNGILYLLDGKASNGEHNECVEGLNENTYDLLDIDQFIKGEIVVIQKEYDPYC
jgi:hypothetical protein